MKRWYDEERGIKMCEPDCVDEWLFDIWAIGCDYDGCHTAKDLKKLIDELVGMANKARECLWERRLFGDHGEPKPQTNAEVVQEWIPVTERLPKDGVRVLAAHDDGVVRIGISRGYFPAVVARNHTKAFGLAEVTHWMPLPEPPMRKEENDG